MAYKITGWEIVPYSPPELLQFQNRVSGSSQDVNSRVTEKGVVKSGVDNNGVMSQHPKSVYLSDTSKTAIAKQQKRTKKTKTKFIGNSYFSFNYCGGSTGNVLQIYEVESPPNLKELKMSGSLNDDERMLPVPGLLKGWKRETRKRQNALRQDKYYTHPWCEERLRSMTSVLDFIRSTNNILNTQAMSHHHESSSSLSENKKRPNSGPQDKSETKRRRIFSVVFAEDDDTAKRSYKQQIEKHLAMAYQNLMNLKPAP